MLNLNVYVSSKLHIALSFQALYSKRLLMMIVGVLTVTNARNTCLVVLYVVLSEGSVVCKQSTR